MEPPEPEPSAGSPPVPGADTWTSLTRFTRARIALGRAGGSWRTETLLDFRLAQAQARDAVHQDFSADMVEASCRQAGYKTERLSTAASDRAAFLKSPDLGRRLSDDSRRILGENRPQWGGCDLVVIISDGLSAFAAEAQAVPTLTALLPPLLQAGWTVAPIFIVPFARVKLQDEVGGILQVRQSLILLGERPGLGSPDSLGAYLTWRPGPERTNADRNCVSNIRPRGLPPAAAGLKLAQLLTQSAAQAASGIRLNLETAVERGRDSQRPEREKGAERRGISAR